MVKANTELKSWRFDFGPAVRSRPGYTRVTATTAYTPQRGYGFLGLGRDGWLEDERSDGFYLKKGQEIVLQDRMSSPDSSAGIADVVVVTDPGMPMRFAVAVEPNTYYQVKVSLAGADPSRDARVNLFSEKRHFHLLDKLIPRGQQLVYEFSVNVQNVYSKRTGVYVDRMLNLGLCGENAAIAGVEIQQQPQGKTLWILGDSTVCDQTAPLPYFPLHNYGGVGQALSKYLGSDIAVSNHGESGLETNSSKPHFENFKEQILAGDFVLFEFGHNHKEVNGPDNFFNNIPHYYDFIRSKGAKLIVVSPIDRHRPEQYDPETNTWQATLREFADKGREFVEQQLQAGRDDIAFVDLHAASLNWYTELCRVLGRKDTSPSFYFRSAKGEGIDRTHPNDAGVDNFAWLFIQAAKDVIAENPKGPQAQVLQELLQGLREEKPYQVHDSITALGDVPNDAFPDS